MAQTTANPTRRAEIAAAKVTAKQAGFFIREGSFCGTTDDRIGQWYVGNVNDDFFRPWGAGHATQGAAWIAAASGE